MCATCSARGGVDRAHQAAVGVDELALDRRTRPQPDPRRRRLAPGPVHRSAARLQLVVDHEVAHGVVEGVTEVVVVGVRERELVRRARDLRSRHERVVGVHHHRFGRAVEQLRGMARRPLVELVVARDQHRRRPPRRASGPADLLAHRGQRAREAVEHDRVEPADVDAELERAGGDDAAELAARELRLELPPLVGEVAGAVGGDRRRDAVVRRAMPRRGWRRARRPCGSG